MVTVARKVKCPYCKQLDEKERLIYQETNKRYWHEECLKKYEEEVEANKTVKDRDKEERKNLIAYICELYDIEAPTGFILKQIKDFHDEPYNYRYYAMQLALEYFFVIKQNSTAKSKGIGIIPYVMDDAKEFYYNLASLQKQDIKKAERETVKVKKTRNNKGNRKKKLIDMEDI